MLIHKNIYRVQLKGCYLPNILLSLIKTNFIFTHSMPPLSLSFISLSSNPLPPSLLSWIELWCPFPFCREWWLLKMVKATWMLLHHRAETSTKQSPFPFPSYPFAYPSLPLSCLTDVPESTYTTPQWTTTEYKSSLKYNLHTLLKR